ncbi:MAG: enolase C-terminal domain-like protein [Planctomycetia bacterium]|nr:enolase C-terminal domain-like protein [Planctomycetia bacterium]
MRFDRIEGYLVRLPLKSPQRYADAMVNFCETVLLRLESDGVSGWSEVCPGNGPILSGEWSGATYLTLRDILAPIVAKMGAAATVESFEEPMRPVKGNRYAKAAVEMAWQDLGARLENKPLWQALGGQKKPLKVGLTFDRAIERDEFFRDLARAAQENYARLSLKLRPGWDVQVLNFARVDSPAWMQLQVDVEGALDFNKHADTLYRMDDFFLNCVEQPLNPRDFVAHAMLSEAVRTPVCLDESIESLEDAKIAFDVGSCRVVCLKPGRVGGHAEAIKIAQLAKENEAKCYAGFDLQSSLGYRHVLALASTDNFVLPTDYLRFDETLEYDVVPQLPAVVLTEKDETGKRPDRDFRFIELWDEPGIGVEPNLEELKPYILDQFEIKRG